MKYVPALLALTLSLVIAFPAHAAWPETGARLSSFSSAQNPRVVSDGAGGCIVAWYDYRNLNFDVFAQRFDRDGNPLWTANGVPVCVQPNIQAEVRIVADNAGGAFIVWIDERTGTTDIYAQRVASDGSMAWQANGKPVCTAASTQTHPAVYSEGGLVLIAWTDYRNFGTTSTDVYAQRVDGNGDPVWTANGVAVCTAFNIQATPEIISDGASGAILAWNDYRSGSNTDVYIHHVNFLGTPDWTPQGVAVTSNANEQSQPEIVSDGQGGVIVGWEDDNGGANPYLYVQRFGPSGASVWLGGAYPIAQGTFYSFYEMISDGSGGAILAWADVRTGVDADVYAQRITLEGLEIWAGGGAPVSTASGEQLANGLVPDGAGGAIVTFIDDRATASQWDIYGQRIDELGITRWDADGTPIVTRPGSDGTVSLAAASDGGILMAFENSGAGVQSFAQRIDSRYGYWGRPDPNIASAADTPADQGGHVTLSWDASDRDVLYGQTITHYSVWRATGTPPAAVAGMTLVNPEDITADFKGKAWRREETAAGAAAYWEFVDNQAAAYLEGYSYNVPTKNDSIGGNAGTHYFQVIAHTGDPWIFWPSNPDSAHSVDNLAPAAPLGLAAMRVGGPNVDLDWSPSGMAEADFKEFWVYRGTTSGFPTDPAHFLTSTPDTTSTDTSADTGGMWYYKVLAVDIHDNPSDESNEAFVSPVTGIGDRAPALTALTVQNYPNPFSGATDIRIGLPAASPVTIAVYDVAGRRVAARDLGVMSAGHQAVTFDGRDASGRALPSGVYFYRVTAGAETATRKIVIRR